MYYNNYPYYQTYVPQGMQNNNAQMQTPQVPQMQAQVAQAQIPQAQMINSDFVKVNNEREARNYPVATGTSVTFKDENAPYIYTKTMGFSQLDIPVFEKYRLEKVDDEPIDKVFNDKVDNSALDELKADIDDYKAQIYDMQTQINDIQTQIEDMKKRQPAKKRTLREELDDE